MFFKVQAITVFKCLGSLVFRVCTFRLLKGPSAVSV